MITFKYVSKRYANGHIALNKVSCTIEAGECVFLTGHSGAGKSTFLRLIAGLERPSRGQVLVDEVPISRLNPNTLPYYRRTLGIISQNPDLLPELTCYENIALPLTFSHIDKQVIEKRVRAALDQVSLGHKQDCLPSALSTGEQQRISIARAIVHRPKIILADEPTGNLDPELSFEIFKLFARFQRIGVTILIATHDLNLIKTLRLRQLTLSHGELIRDEQSFDSNTKAS